MLIHRRGRNAVQSYTCRASMCSRSLHSTPPHSWSTSPIVHAYCSSMHEVGQLPHASRIVHQRICGIQVHQVHADPHEHADRQRHERHVPGVTLQAQQGVLVVHFCMQCR